MTTVASPEEAQGLLSLKHSRTRAGDRSALDEAPPCEEGPPPPFPQTQQLGSATKRSLAHGRWTAAKRLQALRSPSSSRSTAARHCLRRPGRPGRITARADQTAGSPLTAFPAPSCSHSPRASLPAGTAAEPASAQTCPLSPGPHREPSRTSPAGDLGASQSLSSGHPHPTHPQRAHTAYGLRNTENAELGLPFGPRA